MSFTSNTCKLKPEQLWSNTKLIEKAAQIKVHWFEILDVKIICQYQKDQLDRKYQKCSIIFNC